MNTIVAQTINFSNGTYAVIDREHGVVSINEGQRTGEMTDWGGREIAFLTLEQAESIAAILNVQPEPYQPFTDPALRNAQPAEMRDDWIGV